MPKYMDLEAKEDRQPYGMGKDDYQLVKRNLRRETLEDGTQLLTLSIGKGKNKVFRSSKIEDGANEELIIDNLVVQVRSAYYNRRRCEEARRIARMAVLEEARNKAIDAQPEAEQLFIQHLEETTEQQMTNLQTGVRYALALLASNRRDIQQCSLSIEDKIRHLEINDETSGFIEELPEPEQPAPVKAKQPAPVQAKKPGLIQAKRPVYNPPPEFLVPEEVMLTIDAPKLRYGDEVPNQDLIFQAFGQIDGMNNQKPCDLIKFLDSTDFFCAFIQFSFPMYTEEQMKGLVSFFTKRRHYFFINPDDTNFVKLFNPFTKNLFALTVQDMTEATQALLIQDWLFTMYLLARTYYELRGVFPGVSRTDYDPVEVAEHLRTL